MGLYVEFLAAIEHSNMWFEGEVWDFLLFTGSLKPLGEQHYNFQTIQFIEGLQPVPESLFLSRWERMKHSPE